MLHSRIAEGRVGDGALCFCGPLIQLIFQGRHFQLQGKQDIIWQPGFVHSQVLCTAKTGRMMSLKMESFGGQRGLFPSCTKLSSNEQGALLVPTQQSQEKENYLMCSL